MIFAAPGQLPIGYAHNTKHIVVVADELDKLLNELVEKTRAHSHWQGMVMPNRIEEAKAIKDLAGALYSLVRARG